MIISSYFLEVFINPNLLSAKEFIARKPIGRLSLKPYCDHRSDKLEEAKKCFSKGVKYKGAYKWSVKILKKYLQTSSLNIENTIEAYTYLAYASLEIGKKEDARKYIKHFYFLSSSTPSIPLIEKYQSIFKDIQREGFKEGDEQIDDLTGSSFIRVEYQCKSRNERCKTGYWMGKTEVSNNQWNLYPAGRNNPSNNPSNNLPVLNISWDESKKFSTKVGKRFCTVNEWLNAFKTVDEKKYAYGRNVIINNKPKVIVNQYGDIGRTGIINLLGNASEIVTNKEGKSVVMGHHWNQPFSKAYIHTAKKPLPIHKKQKKYYIGLRLCH